MEIKYRKPKTPRYKPCQQQSIPNAAVMSAASDAVIRELNKTLAGIKDMIAYSRTSLRTDLIADLQAAQRSTESAIRRYWKGRPKHYPEVTWPNDKK